MVVFHFLHSVRVADGIKWPDNYSLYRKEGAPFLHSVGSCSFTAIAAIPHHAETFQDPKRLKE